MTRVGVLALQGAFARHVAAVAACGAEGIEVRSPGHLEGLDALIIPGGESTTISKLLVSSGLDEVLGTAVADGLPVFGTCAGMILLAREIADPRAGQRTLAAVDVRVRRNGYGRQLQSFETSLDVAGLDAPYHAVFIRAPVVEAVGPSVEVLASVDDAAVLCRQGSVMVASFHPELTDDHRLHRLFIDTIG